MKENGYPLEESNKQEFQQNGRILWKHRFLKRTEFMKKTRVKLIVKEFYKQMNPDMWDGS